jgi:hypothetical protein
MVCPKRDRVLMACEQTLKIWKTPIASISASSGDGTHDEALALVLWPSAMPRIESAQSQAAGKSVLVGICQSIHTQKVAIMSLLDDIRDVDQILATRQGVVLTLRYIMIKSLL